MIINNLVFCSNRIHQLNLEMKINPKVKRNIYRILPFGAIWLITGWVFLISESILTGNQNLNPDSSISLTLPVFVFASFAVTSVGLLVGAIELIILEKKFKHFSFVKKVIFKFSIYICMMLLIMVVLFPIATIIELNTTLSDTKVWIKTFLFFQSPDFANTTIQISFHLFLSLIYAAISENLGQNVLYNFFTGKYHRPIEESRIFMFLDMKDSTTIAEKLGHKKYFTLLQDYYDTMSDSIVMNLGEVYQYIGDEVVITWKNEDGIKSNNCIKCFYEIKEEVFKKSNYFLSKYGLIPSFKAGIHLGKVTTGEVGALKKEVVFSGDVLNTTARIQGACKEYQSDLIISEDLLKELNEQHLKSNYLGDIQLKGKIQKQKLFAIEVSSST